VETLTLGEHWESINLKVVNLSEAALNNSARKPRGLYLVQGGTVTAQRLSAVRGRGTGTHETQASLIEKYFKLKCHSKVREFAISI
jgi:hypothetical protein